MQMSPQPLSPSGQWNECVFGREASFRNFSTKECGASFQKFPTNICNKGGRGGGKVMI